MEHRTEHKEHVGSVPTEYAKKKKGFFRRGTKIALGLNAETLDSPIHEHRVENPSAKQHVGKRT